jgi:hypothetical protein
MEITRWALELNIVSIVQAPSSLDLQECPSFVRKFLPVVSFVS